MGLYIASSMYESYAGGACVRLTGGRLVIAVAFLACCTSVVGWFVKNRVVPSRIPCPGHIVDAAKKKVPGLIITSVSPERVNQERAWEIRGTDQSGTFWSIDILETGKVMMAERLYHGPPPSVAEPIPNF